MAHRKHEFKKREALLYGESLMLNKHGHTKVKKLFRIFSQIPAKNIFMDMIGYIDAMTCMDLVDCMAFMEFMDAGAAHNLRTF